MDLKEHVAQSPDRTVSGRSRTERMERGSQQPFDGFVHATVRVRNPQVKPFAQSLCPDYGSSHISPASANVGSFRLKNTSPPKVTITPVARDTPICHGENSGGL